MKYSARLISIVLAAAIIVGESIANDWAPIAGDVDSRVVKIYGGGGLAGLEGFQSGVLVEPAGTILTALSPALDTEELLIVLARGERRTAQVVRLDAARGVAIVRFDPPADEPATFVWSEPPPAAGERVWIVSNLFNIAAAGEANSLQSGAIAGRRRASGHLLLDAVTSNPGAAGGAVVDQQGRLVAMIGAERRDAITGAWLNYAIAADTLRDVVAQLDTPRLTSTEEATDRLLGSERLASFGLTLAPRITPRVPAFVDRVRERSAADQAGVVADDLILAINDTPTATVDDVIDALGRRELSGDIRVAIERDERLIEVRLSSPEGSQRFRFTPGSGN